MPYNLYEHACISITHALRDRTNTDYVEQHCRAASNGLQNWEKRGKGQVAKGYLIAHIRVRDCDAFEEFKQLSGAAIKAHNGKVLVRNPMPDHREGGAEGLAIVIEFESLDAARVFYESKDYSDAREVREKIADTDLILVEGL